MAQTRLPETAYKPSQQWELIRDSITEKTLTFFIILISLALPASLWRITTTGWQPIYTVQIIFSCAGIAVYALRHRLSFFQKVIFNVAATGSIGIFGLLSLGLVSNGFLLLLITNFFIATTCSRKITALFAILTLAIIAIVATSYSIGLHTTTTDTNKLLADPATWIVRLITFAFTLLITTYFIISLQRKTIELLKEVQNKTDEITYIANHDQLTGLPLLRLARDRFELLSQQANRNNKKIALMFIDLDGFKAINDNYGHEAGDYVLQTTAKRIGDALRQTDTVARISGDEFLVILDDMAEPQSAAKIAEKIIAEISQPISHKQATLGLGASIGIALYPDNGHDLDTLKQLADEAMYRVKKSNKNSYAFAIH